MKGSIRFFMGMLIALGAVGGIEHSASNSELFYGLLVALTGLAIAYSGTKAMNQNERKF